MGDARRRGRVENGLEHELATRREIGSSERTALRAQAHAVDIAEQAHDAEGVSRANSVYLDLRRAAGLTGGGDQSGDAWDQLLADLARPGPGGGDPTN